MRIYRDPAASDPAAAFSAPSPSSPTADAFERRLADTLKRLGVAPVSAAIAPGSALGPDPDWERVSRAELARLQEAAQTLDELRAEQERKEEERRIKEGKWEELVKEYKEKLEVETRKLQERDRALKTSLRDRELTAALAQHSLVPGASKQLLALVRDQFDVHEDGGQLVVKSRGFEAVDDAVRQLLAQPEYAHFLRATSHGGSGATGGQLTQHTPPPTAGGTPIPANLGEAIVLQWQSRKQQAASTPGSLPVGLGGRIPSGSNRI
jgi:hypothetical protein